MSDEIFIPNSGADINEGRITHLDSTCVSTYAATIPPKAEWSEPDYSGLWMPQCECP